MNPHSLKLISNKMLYIIYLDFKFEMKNTCGNFNRKMKGNTQLSNAN